VDPVPSFQNSYLIIYHIMIYIDIVDEGLRRLLDYNVGATGSSTAGAFDSGSPRLR
jgi:hypothetical protein